MVKAKTSFLKGFPSTTKKQLLGYRRPPLTKLRLHGKANNGRLRENANKHETVGGSASSQTFVEYDTGLGSKKKPATMTLDNVFCMINPRTKKPRGVTQIGHADMPVRAIMPTVAQPTLELSAIPTRIKFVSQGQLKGTHEKHPGKEERIVNNVTVEPTDVVKNDGPAEAVDKVNPFPGLPQGDPNDAQHSVQLRGVRMVEKLSIPFRSIRGPKFSVREGSAKKRGGFLKTKQKGTFMSQDNVAKIAVAVNNAIAQKTRI